MAQNIIVDFSEQILAAEKYGGILRNELKNSDFVIPSERKFPVMTAKDVKDAVSNFGRYKGSMTYDEFKKKLVRLAKRKGLQSSLPKTIKEEFSIKASLDMPENLKKLLNKKAEASELSANSLEKVFEIGFDACASFYRPGKSDAQYALARVNRYVKTKDAALLEEEEYFDFSDTELALASIELIENRVQNEILAKVEIEIDEEDDSEDSGETCDCEDPEMEDSADGKMSKTCAKCGKKMAKAKKKC